MPKRIFAIESFSGKEFDAEVLSLTESIRAIRERLETLARMRSTYFIDTDDPEQNTVFSNSSGGLNEVVASLKEAEKQLQQYQRVQDMI